MSEHSFNSQRYLLLGMAVTLIATVLLPALRTNIIFVLPQLLIVTALSVAPYVVSPHIVTSDLWSPVLRKSLSFSLGAALPLWITLMLTLDLWAITTVAIVGITAVAALPLWQRFSATRISTFQKLAPVVLLQLTSFRQVAFNFLKSILIIIRVLA